MLLQIMPICNNITLQASKYQYKNLKSKIKITMHILVYLYFIKNVKKKSLFSCHKKGKNDMYI